MGLGKTLTILALIALRAEQRHKPAKPAQASGWAGAGTLVVCPSHLCAQWKNEGAKHFKEGGLKVS